MPCGCKGKSAKLPAQANVLPARASTQTKRVAVYEVVVASVVQLSTTSPTAARGEARRLGGSVRVTSRPVEQATELAS